MIIKKILRAIILAPFLYLAYCCIRGFAYGFRSAWREQPMDPEKFKKIAHFKA